MRNMVLSLVAVSQCAEMHFSTAQVILRTTSEPIVIRMSRNPVTHHASDDFKRPIE
jgi:hypothetical protein